MRWRKEEFPNQAIEISRLCQKDRPDHVLLDTIHLFLIKTILFQTFLLKLRECILYTAKCNFKTVETEHVGRVEQHEAQRIMASMCWGL